MDTEPTKAELGAIADEIQRSYRLRRTSDCPTVAVHGLIPGVDAPGKVEGGNFTPDSGQPQPDYFRDAPWYFILTLEDLDRVVFGLNGEMSELLRSQARIARDLARLKQRILRTVNYYADLLPECPEGQAHKSVKGPYTQGIYRIQPERAPEFKLTDRQAALAAGLLRPPVFDLSTGQGLVPLPTASLLSVAAKSGYALPGYTYTPTPPVSYSPPSPPPLGPDGLPVPAELDPPIW